jgi:hypothetical protein
MRSAATTSGPTSSEECSAVLHEFLHVVSDPAHILAELAWEGLTGLVLWPLGRLALRRHDRKHDGPSEAEWDEMIADADAESMTLTEGCPLCYPSEFGGW